MTDIAGMTERDILITVLSKIETLLLQQADHETRLRSLEQGAGSDHESRLRALETTAASGKGFFAGVDWLRTLLVGTPVAAVAWFLGAR